MASAFGGERFIVQGIVFPLFGCSKLAERCGNIPLLRGHSADKSEGIGCLRLVVGMMVSVILLQSFHRHPEEAARLPFVDTALHQPSGAGMS